jgi:hypothetical protein
MVWCWTVFFTIALSGQIYLLSGKRHLSSQLFLTFGKLLFIGHGFFPFAQAPSLRSDLHFSCCDLADHYEPLFFGQS